MTANCSSGLAGILTVMYHFSKSIPASLQQSLIANIMNDSPETLRQEEYYLMLKRFRKKFISEKEWYEYCAKTLIEIMEENK